MSAPDYRDRCDVVGCRSSYRLSEVQVRGIARLVCVLHREEIEAVQSRVIRFAEENCSRDEGP